MQEGSGETITPVADRRYKRGKRDVKIKRYLDE
jgi:hypothetical protein